MVQGRSIWPRSKYRSKYWISFGWISKKYLAIFEFLIKFLFMLFVLHASKSNNYTCVSINLNTLTLVHFVGAVALWSNASALDRKIEGSNLAANFFFQWTTMTREEEEFGNENEKRRAREQPVTRERARSNRLDSKILKEGKRDSIGRI